MTRARIHRNYCLYELKERGQLEAERERAY